MCLREGRSEKLEGPLAEASLGHLVQTESESVTNPQRGIPVVPRGAKIAGGLHGSGVTLLGGLGGVWT